MKVSIILPNFNSSKFIKQTLKSIISQTYKNWELIIVDDNSNDKTKKILLKYKKYRKIKIIFLKKNKGQGFCRNLAIKKSKSDYLAFIDSDDIWKKTKLQKQILFMTRNNFDFTFTNYVTFSDISAKINYINPPQKFNYLSFIKNTSIGTSTMMIKRKIVKGIKFLDVKICEDYYFKCKILKKVKIAYCLGQYLTRYRIRQNSLQSNKIKNVSAIWKINKLFNKLNVLENLISVISISYNSLRKYGLR